VTGEIERAVGYLFVGSAALFPPIFDARIDGPAVAVGTVAPFAALAAFGLLSTEGPLFDLFALESDREAGRLYSLASFGFATTALSVLVAASELPLAAFVAAVFVLTAGNVAGRLAVRRGPLIAGVAAFVGAGTAAGTVGVAAAGRLGGAVPDPTVAAFIAASGALVGALIRSALSPRDDSLVVLSVALVAWFLLGVGPDPTVEVLLVGSAAAAALGYVAYALGTASVTGTLAGVLLAVLAVVLGGYGWFVLLVSFFGLGGLASKYRYEEKLERGIAQENEGARGGGNVFANSAVALVAVVAYAASDGLALEGAVFRLAFGGAVAAALADTFSSEFGGLFDSPRLITTFERVPAGTDGGVTWQGAVAGAVGAGVIAGLGRTFFALDAAATATVLGAGALGMIVDSVLGATLEGGRLGNQAVNFLATLSAGTVAGVAALVI